MTTQNMYGVVLWSDTAAQKAVIWCEDQGDLAFYTPEENSAMNAPSLDAGDLIQFDLSIHADMRRVQNPQLLTQSHAPDLADTLKASTREPAHAPQQSRKIIDLTEYLRPLTSPAAAMVG